MLKARRSEFIN